MTTNKQAEIWATAHIVSREKTANGVVEKLEGYPTLEFHLEKQGETSYKLTKVVEVPAQPE